MIVIVSDLHLGCGDELEDFLLWGGEPAGPAAHLRVGARLELDALFARLLAAKMAHALGAGLLPTLVLLGDTFDLWQVQRPRERPHKALGRILSAHAEVVAALHDWIAAGGRVELVIGSHDQPLVDARAWSLLREAVPGVNASRGGRPAHAYTDEATGLYAEHGHLWHPAYRPRRLDLANATCTAREFVRRVLNAFEPLVPWIDKGATIAEIVRIAQATLAPGRRREAFRLLARGLRATSFLLRVLRPWADGRPADWRELAERENAAFDWNLRRAIAPRPGGTSGPLPAHPRFFAAGHTHHPARRTTRHGVEYLNPGAWKPVAIFEDDRAPAIVQPLPYAQIIPDGSGAWEASVRSWKEEGKAEG